MTPAENILSRLSKDDLIHLALDYQENQDLAFDKITKELRFTKAVAESDSDLAINKVVNESFRNQTVMLERQYWSNAQYSRRETLEISGIPENINDGELEGKVLTVCQNWISISILQTLNHVAGLNQTTEARRQS